MDKNGPKDDIYIFISHQWYIYLDIMELEEASTKEPEKER